MNATIITIAGQNVTAPHVTVIRGTHTDSGFNFCDTSAADGMPVAADGDHFGMFFFTVDGVTNWFQDTDDAIKHNTRIATIMADCWGFDVADWQRAVQSAVQAQDVVASCVFTAMWKACKANHWISPDNWQDFI